jgi:hypothetical protein
MGRGEASGPAERSWHLALLTRAERGRRNRRPADVFFLLVGAVFAGLTAAVARQAPEVDRSLATSFATVLGWAGAFWRTAFVTMLVLAAVVVVAVLLRRRWDLARDLLVATLVLFGLGMLLGGVAMGD